MLSETKLMVGQILQDRNRAKTFLTDVMETELSGFRHVYQKNALLDVFGETGPRPDIMIEDEDNNCFVIQCLGKADGDLLQLRRRYQCLVDDYYFHQVGCGMDFPELHIVFICDYDYFGFGLARHYAGDILDDGSEIEDGRHMIVLNSQYRYANAEPKLLELLDRIRSSEAA